MREHKLVHPILALLSKLWNRENSSETVVDGTLPADVGAAQRTCSPLKLPLPADVVATKSFRLKTKKAVSRVRTANHWPYCRLVLSSFGKITAVPDGN